MATAVPPPALPVRLEQLKAYLRVAGSDEDALLAGLLRSATDLCEAFTGLALIERDAVQMLPARRAWTRLDLTPVRAIESVALIDSSGGQSPLASADHGVDIDAAGDGWVRVLRGAESRVAVRYRAGQATDWNGVAEPLRQGIVRMAAHFYTHRDREDGSGPPAAVTALWLPYRRLRLS